MASEAHNSRSSKRSLHSRGSGHRSKKAARAAAHRERTTGDTTSPAEFRLQRAERVTGLRGAMALIMMDFWIKNLPSGARNIADLLEQAQQEQFNFQPADLDLLASRLMPQQIEAGNALLRQINPTVCTLCEKVFDQPHSTSRGHVQKVVGMAMLDCLLGKPGDTSRHPGLPAPPKMINLRLARCLRRSGPGSVSREPLPGSGKGPGD